MDSGRQGCWTLLSTEDLSNTLFQSENDPMHVLTTIGPDNSTKAVLPFIAGKGAMSRGESVAMFAMQEATYLGAPSAASNDL
ncbi:MAG: hypothetical protein BRD55_05730 [Bacteroidetes bacterium SW_9_63_38]|nr:MAG: hypothetical protein BRD55_05730 [Bacteroidetes bacterium SW_9_63_38]